MTVIKNKDSEEKIVGFLVHPPLHTQTSLSLSTLMGGVVCPRMKKTRWVFAGRSLDALVMNAFQRWGRLVHTGLQKGI